MRKVIVNVHVALLLHQAFTGKTYDPVFKYFSFILNVSQFEYLYVIIVVNKP